MLHWVPLILGHFYSMLEKSFIECPQTKIKLYYARKTLVSKWRFYSKMSVLASKPKFTSWETDFDRAGCEIQNRVTKLFVKIFKFWWDMTTFQVLPSTLSTCLKNAWLSAPDKQKHVAWLFISELKYIILP